MSRDEKCALRGFASHGGAWPEKIRAEPCPADPHSLWDRYSMAEMGEACQAKIA